MYIVTGGAGFIGSAVIARLNEIGIEDIIIVDDLGESEKWLNIRNKAYLDYIQKDAFLTIVQENFKKWLAEYNKPLKGIVHLGACSATDELNMDFLFHNNVHYSQTLARLARTLECRFIYASSGATYGNGEKGFSDDDSLEHLQQLTPLNRYGYSKSLFDIWAKKNGYLQSAVGLKFFNVYGPNEYHKGSMKSPATWGYEQIKANRSLKLFASENPEYANGEHTRDFVYIKDCVDVILWLLENPEVHGLFNLGTGRATSWNEMASTLFEAMDIERQVEFVPMPTHLKEHYQYYTQASMEKHLY